MLIFGIEYNVKEKIVFVVLLGILHLYSQES